MNMPGKYWGWALPVSLFSGAVASAVGICIGYHLGLHAYDDVLLDQLLADMYYADNPVDCLPCDEGKTYEWFYVEPPFDSDGTEEEEIPMGKEEGGVNMGP